MSIFKSFKDWFSSLLEGIFYVEVNEEIYSDRLTKNFSESEVLPKGTKWSDLTKEQQDNLLDAVSLAEKVREDIGNVPITINTEEYYLRGFRTDAQQESLIKKGLTTAKNSKHEEGKALDLISSVGTKKLANSARKHFNTVIEYPKKGFVHVDTALRNGEKFFKIM